MELIITIQHKTKQGLYIAYSKSIDESEIEEFLNAMARAKEVYDPYALKRLNDIAFELIPHYSAINGFLRYIKER
ncbi:MAG: hypothetical protein ACTSPK_00035 [Candidatus Heimdallarchaeota archaeon]